MKIKVIVLLLLVSFIAPSMTAYLWLSYQKAGIKNTALKEITTKTNKDQFVLLKFSKTEAETLLRWEHPKEFEFNRNMYDIVEIFIKEDSIHYWCYWDKDETEINRKIHALLAQKQQSEPLNKASRELVDYFLKSLFIDNEGFITILPPTQAESILPRFDCFLNSIIISPPTPPPKLS